MDIKTKEKFVCRTHHIDEASLEKLKISLNEEEELSQLSNMFKALSDNTRLRIIYILSKKELCVCDIANILEMTQSAISHQLKILRDLDLVKFRRRGKLIIYSLDDDHVLELLEQGLDHAKHK